MKKLFIVLFLFSVCLFAQTSNFTLPLRTAGGAKVTTGTVELLPWGNTYPTGTLAMTHLGEGVWGRNSVPYNDYSLYYNGTLVDRYQKFWIGAATIKQKLDKIGFSISGSDTNMTAWGKWTFKKSTTFMGNNTYNGSNTFNGPLLVPSTETLSGLGFSSPSQRELRMDGDSLLYYFDANDGTIKYLASREWVAAQNFGSGDFVTLDTEQEVTGYKIFSGITSILKLGLSNKNAAALNNNELAFNMSGELMYKKFAGEYYDTTASKSYIRGLASYLNPNDFTVTGTPDSVSLNRSWASYTDGTGGTLNYTTKICKINPSANITYNDFSTTLDSHHELTIYNLSPTYTVTIDQSVSIKMAGTSFTLSTYDSITFINDGTIWIEKCRSDN